MDFRSTFQKAEPERWARSLRVIGQEVSKFKPDFLEIEVRGEGFVVRGTSTAEEANACQSDTPNVLRFLKAFLDRSGEDTEQVSLKSFELRYSAKDIDRLDSEWAQRRRTFGKGADLYSLPELFRTIGWYIDSEENRLVRLTKETQTLFLRVRDSRGNFRTLQCSMAALYKNQRNMVSKRGSNNIKDVWKQYDL